MKELHNKRGYISVHKELFKDYIMPWESVFLLGYIIEVYPILQQKVEVDGIEYRRFSDTFINEGLMGFGENKTINKRLQPLIDNGFIKVEHLDNKGRRSKKGYRFIHLDTKVVSASEDTTDSTSDSMTDSTTDGTTDSTSDSKNYYQKNNKDIKDLNVPNDNNDVLKKDSAVQYKVNEIMKYLNDTLKTKYRWDTDKVYTVIKTKLDEGFNVDDFKTVVNNVSMWAPQYRTGWVPEKLFGDKFEQYLNSKPVTKSDGMHFNKNNNTEPKTEVIVI